MLTSFIQLFIKEDYVIPNLKVYFILYLINTAISYLYIYKQSLIIAYQKGYISSTYHYIFVILRNIVQVIDLIKYKDFLFYLLVQMVFTIFENWLIAKKTDKMFPCLKEKYDKSLDSNTFSEIKKNTVAMLFHKIVSVVVNDTETKEKAKFVFNGINFIGFWIY